MNAKPPPIRDTDDEARRLAKTLVREARYGALACLEPGTGRPLASRVSLAADMSGDPLFLISQLSAHFGALEADARASLLIGEPGAGDPLAHPRLSAIGRCVKISNPRERGRVRPRFLARHPKATLYADFDDFAFWRLEIERVSLNAGFGKAFELTRSDVETTVDGFGAMLDSEPGAVAHMNDDHRDAIGDYATGLMGLEPGPWRLASLDPEGMDLAVGDIVRRFWFQTPLQDSEALRPRLVELARAARGAAT